MSRVVGPKSTRSRLVAAVILLLVLAVVGLTFPLFVFPDLNAPQKADAIVVLGGNGAGPFDEGVALARAHYAPTLVLSLTPQYSCGRTLRQDPAERLLCFRANPLSTRGEGRAIAHLAALHHWDRVIVVMPTTQATRARLRIGRCYSGPLLEVGVTTPGFWAWVRDIVYEWPALMKALVLQPTC
jgi:hypothetical protein